jgi:fatty acid desaturase
MSPRNVDRLAQLARLVLAIALLALSTAVAGLPGAVVAAAALWLCAFEAAHDLVHNAFQLGRRAGALALTIAGALMLSSGHAMLVSHLWHHKSPMADDDYEGAAAEGSVARAVLWAPWWALAARLSAYRRAGAKLRRRQLAEHALALALTVALWAAHVPALRVYVVVALLAQLTAPVWAGRIPHRAPAWLLKLATLAARLGSPTALSLAYHDRHHEEPRIPTRRLAAA